MMMMMMMKALTCETHLSSGKTNIWRIRIISSKFVQPSFILIDWFITIDKRFWCVNLKIIIYLHVSSSECMIIRHNIKIFDGFLFSKNLIYVKKNSWWVNHLQIILYFNRLVLISIPKIHPKLLYCLYMEVLAHIDVIFWCYMVVFSCSEQLCR
jgi:hypothetical protein